MKKIAFLLLFLAAALSVQARKLLADLDFSSGRWEMIGVSLHNYQLLPVQQEVGTFILREPVILKQIRDKWDFEEVFEDYCDYHYALKFYRNGELQQTLKVNMVCNYITLGGFSYKFSLKDFEEFRRYFAPIKWSRIRFRNLDLLKIAVNKLDQLPGVYWYGDVQQYNFKGYFTVGVNDLPWNADRDSVLDVLSDRIHMATGRDDYYLDTHYWTISDDFEKMNMVIDVYCNEEFYKGYKMGNDLMRWRNHLSDQSFVQIIVIGLNREDYHRVMADYGGEAN